VSVALHEFGHGLGFLTFVSQSGTKLSGLDDAFMRNLEDQRTGKFFPVMTDTERASASVATDNLHWAGPFADALGGAFTAGTGPNGHIHMYAPSSYQSGSSVSHVDTTLTPNEVMEPSYTGPNHDITLTLEFLEDIGWKITSGAPAATATPLPTRTPTATRTATPAAATPANGTATPRPTATPAAVAAPTCGAVPASGCRGSDVPEKSVLTRWPRAARAGDGPARAGAAGPGRCPGDGRSS